MQTAEARQLMLTKLAASGLDAAAARALGYKPCAVAPPKIGVPGAGFVIPYYKLADGSNGFFRYRYLEPVTLRGKTLRYTQPTGMAPEPYFPRNFPWRDHLAAKRGADRVVLITEGELKAACSCAMGFPTIGLGGVWNFKSRAEGLIAGLREIDWTDAVVYIVYDSDARSNYQVMQAENALARELLALKAHTFIVRLPALTEGAKTGLDDYLVAKGPDALDALLKTTEPWAAARQLHELNEEVVYVHAPGVILELSTGQRMTAELFRSSVYANRVWEELAAAASSGKTKVVKRSAAAEWVKWPARGEVARATYQPGRERILETTREVNTWHGWAVEPRRGSVELWRRFLDYFFHQAPVEDRKWFEQWLAAPLQQPGLKLFSAVVAHSTAQGAGKSLVGHTMQQIYGKNFSEIGESELVGNFNEWAENKQFVMGEEITGGDKRGVADRLKAVITRNTIRINAKYVPTYTLPDCINYYFTSNHPDSFFLDDADRRYFVHELRYGPLPWDFVRQYDPWFHSKEGAAALFAYFLDLDLKDFDPKAPAHVTASKREMIELGRSEAAAWIAALREQPEKVLKLADGPPLKHRLLTLTALFRLWDPMGNKQLTPQGLARALKAGGFRRVNQGEPVWTHTEGAVRLWVVQGDRAALEQLGVKQAGRVYDEDMGARPLSRGLKQEKF